MSDIYIYISTTREFRNIWLFPYIENDSISTHILFGPRTIFQIKYIEINISLNVHIIQEAVQQTQTNFNI